MMPSHPLQQPSFNRIGLPEIVAGWRVAAARKRCHPRLAGQVGGGRSREVPIPRHPKSEVAESHDAQGPLRPWRRRRRWQARWARSGCRWRCRSGRCPWWCEPAARVNTREDAGLVVGGGGREGGGRNNLKADDVGRAGCPTDIGGDGVGSGVGKDGGGVDEARSTDSGMVARGTTTTGTGDSLSSSTSGSVGGGVVAAGGVVVASCTISTSFGSVVAAGGVAVASSTISSSGDAGVAGGGDPIFSSKPKMSRQRLLASASPWETRLILSDTHLTPSSRVLKVRPTIAGWLWKIRCNLRVGLGGIFVAADAICGWDRWCAQGKKKEALNTK
ncbi:unnamed protein product [Urochloa humidicola]